MANTSFDQLNKNFGDININYVLKTYGFQDQVISEWNDIKEDIYGRGVDLYEFRATSHDNNHWALIINATAESSKRSRKYFYQDINENLKSSLIRRENNKLSELFSRIQLTGLFIPMNDIKEVKAKILKSQLIFSSLLIKYYPYQEFFSKLISTTKSLKPGEELAPYALWTYIIYYAKFLYKVKNDNYGLYEIYRDWFSKLLDLENFHRRLPSEQITILLLNRCESIISNTDYDSISNRKYSKAIDEVSTFFEENDSGLNMIFGEQAMESEESKINESYDKLQAEFAKIVLLDSDDLLVQEILDNSNKLNLSLSLPVLTQVKYGLKGIYQAGVVVKDKVLGEDDRPAGLFKEDDESLPNYVHKKQRIYPTTLQYWYDLIPAEKEKLVQGIRKKIPSESLNRANHFVRKRREANLLNLINQISAPVLNWTIEDGNFFAQWNLFSDEMTKSLIETLKKKKEDGRKEMKILEKHLKEIFELDSMMELTSYLHNNKPIFSQRKYQLKWEQELERISRIIRNREKFYESRMEEFGIKEAKLNNRQKQMWVQEMMEIEDEIKPYIKYVKQAFQTALPIRRTVKFSEERHKSDGVEFDPDTLFDHEKWIRANVMKVMESSIERGEATQINTFCLDYSGSMNHDRMRNLFKMLYLLVLGLEDRKSYDAFHFFSDEFIEVVGFSKEFTNRKVLFKILQQIAQIHIGKVIYFGEGGTNISSGIKMSHEKMLKFSKEFKAENPEANVVTSIFVITDGEPSLGITNIPKLNDFIEQRRLLGDVEIKGIFIKSEDDVSLEFMEEIFGNEHFVETTDFQEGVNKFVKIMTETYKKQRKSYKWKQKRKKLGLTD